MIQKMKGVVLGTLNYNDRYSIVHIYTDVNGRSSFLIARSRSKKKRLHQALFQPLSLIEFDADINPKKQLYTIKEAAPTKPLCSIPYSPYKASIALFLAEFLKSSLREELPNKELYSFLVYAILWLDNCDDKQASNFHIVFLMRLTLYLGILPNLETYHEGNCFDLQNACFTDLAPQIHSNYLIPGEASVLYLLRRMNFGTMKLFRFNRIQRKRCLDIIITYYRLHISSFPELKSLEVLKELFSS